MNTIKQIIEKRKNEMPLNFIVGKYFSKNHKNDVKIFGGFPSESAAKSFAEWKEVDSFGGIFFVWDCISDTVIFYSSTELKNERWLPFEKSTMYNAATDSDIPLDHIFYGING